MDLKRVSNENFNLIYIGKIVNTHGIKGEVRLLSNFLEKDLIFKNGFKVYIGSKKEEQTINTYRPHKQFDMLTFKGIDDINLVLKYKGEKVYINKDDLQLKENEYLLEDLIGMKIVSEEEVLGVVSDIIDTKEHKLLYVTFAKNYYIPYNSYYIKQVDVRKKEITAKNIRDLIL